MNIEFWFCFHPYTKNLLCCPQKVAIFTKNWSFFPGFLCCYHLSKTMKCCYLPTGVLANLLTEILCSPCLLAVVRWLSSRGFCMQKDEYHCKCTSFVAHFPFTSAEFFFVIWVVEVVSHCFAYNFNFLFAVFNLTNGLLKVHAIKKNQDYYLIAHVKPAFSPGTFEVNVWHRTNYKNFLGSHHAQGSS